jgi:hypothetical protein
MILQKRAARLFSQLALINSLTSANAFADSLSDKKSSLIQLRDFDALLGKKLSVLASNVSVNALPSPYDFLLTQPLMTLGMEHYYQRRPTIQTIYALKNNKANTYFRLITLLIDSNKIRNNLNIAKTKKDAVVVGLASITMNFAALPETIKNAVLKTQQPFGELLARSKIDIIDADRRYFSLRCNAAIAKYIHCKEASILYGRSHTIVAKDNGQWLARVVEILSGLKCQEKSCRELGSVDRSPILA